MDKRQIRMEIEKIDETGYGNDIDSHTTNKDILIRHERMCKAERHSLLRLFLTAVLERRLPDVRASWPRPTCFRQPWLQAKTNIKLNQVTINQVTINRV